MFGGFGNSGFPDMFGNRGRRTGTQQPSLFGGRSPFGGMMQSMTQLGFGNRGGLFANAASAPESPADKIAREDRERNERKQREDQKRKLNGDPTIEEESTLNNLHSFVAKVEDKVSLYEGMHLLYLPFVCRPSN